MVVLFVCFAPLAVVAQAGPDRHLIEPPPCARQPLLLAVFIDAYFSRSQAPRMAAAKPLSGVALRGRACQLFRISCNTHRNHAWDFTSHAARPSPFPSTILCVFLCCFSSQGDPYGEARGVLCVPDGDAETHGARVPRGGAGARGRGVCHLPRPSEEERPRCTGKQERNTTKTMSAHPTDELGRTMSDESTYRYMSCSFSRLWWFGVGGVLLRDGVSFALGLEKRTADRRSCSPLDEDR